MFHIKVTKQERLIIKITEGVSFVLLTAGVILGKFFRDPLLVNIAVFVLFVLILGWFFTRLDEVPSPQEPKEKNTATIKKMLQDDDINNHHEAKQEATKTLEDRYQEKEGSRGR
jgi:hypothetical protein